MAFNKKFLLATTLIAGFAVSAPTLAMAQQQQQPTSSSQQNNDDDDDDDATEVATVTVTGVETTKAHGQAMTSMTSA